eukprot:259896-Chlamydomonas_euryale.AAC.2
MHRAGQRSAPGLRGARGVVWHQLCKGLFMHTAKGGGATTLRGARGAAYTLRYRLWLNLNAMAQQPDPVQSIPSSSPHHQSSPRD